MRCCICSQPIKLPEERHELRNEVTGYERKRPGGGLNTLELRKQTGRAAHQRCIDNVKRGLLHQTELRFSRAVDRLC